VGNAKNISYRDQSISIKVGRRNSIKNRFNSKANTDTFVILLLH